ncbi:ABC transporter substrate-binding protein [Nonomuraea ferruginea]
MGPDFAGSLRLPSARWCSPAVRARKSAPSPAGETGNAGWSAGADTIKIGLIAPMTGAYAILGILQENSIRVEMDRVNEAGGVGGAKLELVVRDTALDPAKAVQASNELVGDSQVHFVVGPSLSAFYNASKNIFETNSKLNCQPGVGTGDFGSLKYGFRSQDPNNLSVEKLVEYLKAKGVSSVGLVYEADDTGKAMDGYLKEYGPKYGVEYKGYQETRNDDQSHRPYVDALKDSRRDHRLQQRQRRQDDGRRCRVGLQGRDGLSTSGLQNVSFLDAAQDMAVGSVFAAGNVEFNIRDRATWKPGYRAHVEAVEKKYGVVEGPKSGAKMPKGTAIAGDCIVAFAAAAESAKSLDADKLATAMEQLNIPDTETASGNTIKPADHEFYHMEDIHVYQWDKDADGWFVTDVTPQS